MLTELLADLRDEHDELVRIVAAADLDVKVPAEPWDVRDTASHLLVGNAKATVAISDPAAFQAELPQAAADPAGYLDTWLAAGRDLPQGELLDRWRQGFEEMVAAFGTNLARHPPGTKVPWFGPPMSSASFATARIMEYWAHGQDVVDGLGVRRVPTARLRHIALLGVRTRGFSYAVRGLALPDGDVRVSLKAPDGSTWEWGSGDDAVEGSAEGFCLRVTQRRHRDDTDLVTTGPLADDWMDHAQCFAGLPTEGRPPR